jgi:hypothetical protein
MENISQPTYEKVTGATYQGLLTDPRFIAGLDESLRISKKTGLETAFSWRKSIGSPVLHPSQEIMVGKQGSVGPSVGQERVIKMYELETGQSAYDDNGKIKDDVIYFDSKMQDQDISSTVEYPGEEDENPQGSDQISYKFLSFHTHPDIAFPSEDDFKVLNRERNSPFNSKFFSEPVSPLGFVVSKEQSKDGLHYLACYKGKPIDFQEFIAYSSILSHGDVRSRFHENGSDIAIGNYNPLTKEIRLKNHDSVLLSPSESLGDFSFETKINEERLQKEIDKSQERQKRMEKIAREIMEGQNK